MPAWSSADATSVDSVPGNRRAISPDHGFGAALRAVRKQLGLTQQALALAVGTTQRHVSFLETGRSAPSRRMLGGPVIAPAAVGGRPQPC